ncbi:MAG TPA: hypothetical protein VIV11_16895 [Kofleriaceae bacterium]
MRWMPLVVVLLACGDPKDKPDAAQTPDTPPMVDAPIDADPNNPMTLMDTGLCVDAACMQIAPGIKAYKPQFELYSDGATKKRWIYLPPSTQINTSNMDFWEFPVGTKLWKEFTRGSVRVETRLVMRISDSNPVPANDWFYVAFVWNSTQDATVAERFGVPDANGTEHDVPSRAQCKECHDKLPPSRVLGFSAIQVDWDDPDASAYDLAGLVADNKLTNPPPPPTVPGPYFPVPGRANIERPALGYLHANCGTCHNPNSSVYIDNGVLMQLRLTTGTLGSLAATTVYTTAVGVNATTTCCDGNIVTKLVEPTQPDQSAVTVRFESTNPAQRMPAVGTEVMDPTGRTTLRTWITNIP